MDSKKQECITKMEQMTERKEWKCPRCGRKVKDYPAISRRDDKTEICSACGTDEAMFDFTVSKEIENEKKWLEEEK